MIGLLFSVPMWEENTPTLTPPAHRCGAVQAIIPSLIKAGGCILMASQWFKTDVPIGNY